MLETIPNALGHPDRVVVPHEEYLGLGEETEERRRASVALFAHEVSGRAITAIREGMEKGRLLGVNTFKRRWRVGYNGG